MMAFGSWVDGLTTLWGKLRRQDGAPASSVQVNVSGNNNDVKVVLPGTGRDISDESSPVRPARPVVPRSKGR